MQYGAFSRQWQAEPGLRAAPAVIKEYGLHPGQKEAATCVDCHKPETEKWLISQHASANRPVDATLDDAAFDPPHEVVHGTLTSTVRKVDGRYEIVTPGPDGTRQVFEPQGVIAISPLRQYLLPLGRGALQASQLAYDPRSNEWFDVYQGENRQPHEWGSGMGRGMTWNVQCAYCHMTNLQKNYDPESDTYHTAWDELAISCAECHGDLTEHTRRHRADDPPPSSQLTTNQYMHACAACHTRRGELVGDFEPGDNFFDHFRASLVNAPGIYYADGQIRDEDFEFGSFMMSKMHDKGVTCLDCHDSHSGENLFTAENNTLCLVCHAPPGNRGAIPIDPVAHSFHQADNRGSLCIECHMSETSYMVRDPRRDHGFTSPDPVLTRDLGIPNACNKCHNTKPEETVDWAIEWVEKWYGDKMNGRRARKRAYLVHRAREEGDETVVPELLALAKEEENVAWKHSLLLLLQPWSRQTDVFAFALQSLKHEHELVRSAAVQVLAGAPGTEGLLRALLEDPVRLVRLDAAWALAGRLQPAHPAHQELMQSLEFHSDQPWGAARRAQLAAAEQRFPDAEKWIRRAASWDQGSAHVQHMLGTILNYVGKQTEAMEAFKQALKMDPENRDHPYALALLSGEMGRTQDTLKYLVEAVRIDPNFGRAWYNLGLARAQMEQLDAAVNAMRRAETLEPDNPDYVYARATVHLRLNQPDEARQAAEKALSINPTYRPALGLLQQVNRPATPGGQP